MLTKAQIFSANDRPREFVPIEEWAPAGETFDPFQHGVYVGMMSAADREAWEVDFSTDTNGKRTAPSNARARLVVKCCQDEAGERLFSDADAEELGRRATKPIQRLFDRAVVVNKLSRAEHEELEKN